MRIVYASALFLMACLNFQFTPVSHEPEPITVLLNDGGWLEAYPTRTNGVFMECVRYHPWVLQGWPEKERQ